MQVVTQDVTGKMHLDFSSPQALATLATTLFRCPAVLTAHYCSSCNTMSRADFQLEVEVPPTGLIPTLPSRLNYLLWVQVLQLLVVTEGALLPVQDLLALLPGPLGTVQGLDVGTGATAVYPLLAARYLKTMNFPDESEQRSKACSSRNPLSFSLKNPSPMSYPYIPSRHWLWYISVGN